MLKNHRRSIFVAFALIFLAIGAFFMANVEMPRWSYVISSINVLLFALPAFYALRRWLGWSDGIKLVLILGAYALLVETLAILTGFPYGHFGYSEHLGYKLFGYVPLDGGVCVDATDALRLCRCQELIPITDRTDYLLNLSARHF